MSSLTNQTESMVVPLKGSIVLPQAEYDALFDLEGEFDVVCYQVNYNSKLLMNHPLSPLLETRKQASEFLEEIKKTIPLAKMGKHVFYYSSVDADGREELLNKIVKAEVSDE